MFIVPMGLFIESFSIKISARLHKHPPLNKAAWRVLWKNEYKNHSSHRDQATHLCNASDFTTEAELCVPSAVSLLVSLIFSFLLFYTIYFLPLSLPTVSPRLVPTLWTLGIANI